MLFRSGARGNNRSGGGVWTPGLATAERHEATGKYLTVGREVTELEDLGRGGVLGRMIWRTWGTVRPWSATGAKGVLSFS